MATKKKVTAYSYSRLDKFIKCRLMYKLAVLDKVPEEETPALRIGRAVHTAIAAYTQHCQAGKIGSDLEAAVGFVPRRGMAPAEVTEAVTIMAKFAETHIIDEHPSMIEQQLAFDGNWGLLGNWFDPSVRFRMVMDRMIDFGDFVDVTDYKTNRHLPSKTETETDFQLKTYAFGSHILCPDAEEFRVSTDYVRYGVIREPEERISVAEAQEAGGELERLMDEADGCKKWGPSPGNHCGYCSYVGTCPLYEGNGTTLKPATSDETAKELAERIRVAEEFCKNGKKLLKEWVKEHGGIPVGDQVLDFHLKEGTEFPDILGLVGGMKARGIDKATQADVLGTTQAKLKKHLEWDDYIEIKDKFGRSKESTQFEYGKVL